MARLRVSYKCLFRFNSSAQMSHNVDSSILFPTQMHGCHLLHRDRNANRNAAHAWPNPPVNEKQFDKIKRVGLSES